MKIGSRITFAAVATIIECMTYFILPSPCRMPQKTALIITIGPIFYPTEGSHVWMMKILSDAVNIVGALARTD